MKKLMKVVLLVSAALMLASCGSTPKAEGTKKIQKGDAIDLSKVAGEIDLVYNEWGTTEYSRFQSFQYDITDMFKKKLPKKGDELHFIWKGKCDSDIKELHMLITNIEKKSSGGEEWTHLIDEDKRNTPVITDIKADEEFEIDVRFVLDTDVKNNVIIFFCCGEDDIYGEVSDSFHMFLDSVSGKKDLTSFKGHVFGAHTWQSRVSGNVITWEKGYDNADAGWDFSGMDLSVYDRVCVEIESTDAPVYLRFADKDWNLSIGFPATGKNIFVAKLTGEGSWEYEGEPIFDLSKGFRIYLNQYNNNVVRTEDKTTVVKSIKFLKPGEAADIGPLGLMDRGFGGVEEKCSVEGNTVTWVKGSRDANAGWNLERIDLSEYDSVRITLEKTDVPVDFVVTDKNQGKWKFARKIDSNVYEMKLTGEGANSEEPLIDKSEGVRFFVHFYSDQPLKKDCTTVVKKIELLKESAKINEQFMLVGKELGSSGYRSFVKDNGVIEWEWDKKEKYPSTGWNFRDVDLSAYNKIRVEIEATDVPNDIRLVQDGCHIGFRETKPGVLEARFDGQGFDWMWEEKGPWDPSKKIEEIHIRADNLSKSGKKTVIKSVQFLNEEEKVQPESIRIGDSKLGSKKDNAWLDDDFAINWKKANYAGCGWRLEKVEGDIFEVKVSSTDDPLRLRIREYASGNEASWEDDGSHVFRIQLDTRKMESKNGLKNPEWIKFAKEPDYSKGCEIVLEPSNGVFKNGKKTVVESVWIKSWEDTLN